MPRRAWAWPKRHGRRRLGPGPRRRDRRRRPRGHGVTATSVCIVGCGAIGSLFAAHLGRLPDVEVWAYDVSPAHVDAINADGLRITGATDFRAEVHASTDPSRIPPCDLGIVAVKSAYTEAAIAATAPILQDAADALGIALDADPEAMIDDAIDRAFGHRASMLQDVTAHRATEVDVLNGGIVAAAREAGLEAPLNEAMVALVHGIEASWALPAGD